LALELGLVHEWCDEARSTDQVRRRAALERLAFVCFYEPCRRVAGDLVVRALQDPDRAVALLAARAIIHSADLHEIEQVFEVAVSEDVLARISLNGDLRRHAVPLCERAVPAALASKDRNRVRATLGTLAAWERAIPLANLEEFLRSQDRSTRLEAIRLAPFVSVTPGIRTAMVEAVSDDDPEISIAAAVSAARLRLEESLPFLPAVLRIAPGEVARAATIELAGMGAGGRQVLEELRDESNAVTASAAREALAIARRGQPE